MNGDQRLDYEETMEIGVKTGFKQGFQAGYERGKSSQKAVLDKIRVELHRIQPTIWDTDEYRKGVYDGMCYAVDRAIKIIDKYRKGAE